VLGGRLGDEPRLPDTRLAEHRDDRTAAVEKLVQHAPQRLELARATHEGRQGRRRLDVQFGHDPKSLDGRALALQLDLTERLEHEPALDLTCGRRPDRDPALARERLQAGGDVDGVAERVVAHLVGQISADEQDRPRVHRDPPGEPDPVSVLDLAAVAGQRSLDRPRGANGAFGIVLVRGGGTEDREQPVAGQLRHCAAESVDFLAHQADDLVEKEFRPLRP
jgi:hypothetical protein